MKSRSGKPLLKYQVKEYAPGLGIDCLHHGGVWDDPTACTQKPGYVHVDCWRFHFGVGTVALASGDISGRGTPLDSA